MPTFKDKLKAAEKHLARADQTMARLIREIGPCALRPLRWSPYESLMRAIAHQQLNGRAAQTILGRFVALYPGQRFPEPHDVLATHFARLRSVGFSRNKVTAIRDIAAKARRVTDCWQPFRSVGSWYLWRHADGLKNKKPL